MGRMKEMRLSARTRYAVMAMIELGFADHSVSLAAIAKRQNLPQNFLEQLFSQLRKSKLVKSVRGYTGGFQLAKRAEDITLLEIIDAVGDPIRTTGCHPSSTLSCTGGAEKCITHDLWMNLAEHITKYLDSITLAEICRDTKLPERPVKYEEYALGACV